MFLGMNVVFADDFGDYTYYYFSKDYARSNDDRIIYCSYYSDSQNKSLRVQFTFENDMYQVHYFYDGDEDANVDLDPIADLKDGEISPVDLTDYIRINQTCPSYAIPAGESYYFSNKIDSDSTKHLVLLKSRYNKDYCYYKFDSSTKWGMFIHKDYLGNLEDGYDSEEKKCPSTITMELNLFSYGTIPAYIFSDKVDVNECRKRVSTLLSESDAYSGNYLEYSDGLKCYTGNLIDHIKNQADKEQEELYDPNHLLNCEALFDEESKKFISNAYFFLELIAIALIVVLTIGDYASAMLQSNQDDMKKSNSKLVRRLIILAILFLLPSLLRFVFRITNVDIFDTRSPYCGAINIDD